MYFHNYPMLTQKNVLFIVLMLVGSVAIFSCNSSKHTKTKRLPGVWQATPITIDGSNKDWPSPYPEYDDKAQLGYAISNDKENLYITVETGDPATQLKILQEGLTVWIDKTGGKEEQTAINFPIPNPNKEENTRRNRNSANKNTDNSNADRPTPGQFQQGSGGPQDRQRMAIEDRVTAALKDATDYSLQGFKSCNLQYPLIENDSCGIKVRMAIDADNELIWEAVVPFSAFYSKKQIARVDKGKAISICIETVAMKRPPGEGSGNQTGGGGGGMRPSIGIGGMGIGMGGGHGGNRGGPQQPNMMEPAYKSTITWKRFGIGFSDK
jgi:hypothetical protein